MYLISPGPVNTMISYDFGHRVACLGINAPYETYLFCVVHYNMIIVS